MVIDEAELEEEKLVIDMEEIAMNVNRPEDLEIAERLFKRLFRWSPSNQ
jgi:GTP:adenosylcobinamide-phosphate guanylyltransferase